MKRSIITLIVLSFLVYDPIMCNAGEKVISHVSPSATSINQYERFEVTFELLGDYKNLFDYGEVSAEAEVLRPDGSKIIIPAFYTGRDTTFAVRYTPVSAGSNKITIHSKTSRGSSSSEPFFLDVVPSELNGFVRKSKNNTHFLVFDSGKPFFGIGHNVGWVTGNSMNVYENYFKLLSQNGCNMTRLWVNCPWTLKIEYNEAGTYHISDSHKLDRLITLAEKYGIYVVLVFDSYGSLMKESGPWNEQNWDKNPYNRKNGGPCTNPQDFFTDPEAKRLYKNRLKYIAARWGYSPNILAFELWNEVDASKEWYAEMFGFMKSVSPHGQLLTTSMSYPWDNNFDEGAVWKLDGMDIIQKHIYGSSAADVIGYIVSTNAETAKMFKKPFFLGEFGLDAAASDGKIDRTGSGAALHSSLWASTLSGSFSTPLNWWWEEYIRARNMYPHYKAIAAFLDGVDWNSKNVAFPETSVTLNSSGELSKSEASTDVVMIPVKSWGDSKYAVFTVLNNGDVQGGVVNHYLQGTIKKEMRIEPVFKVDYPADGLFRVDVGTVSQGSELVAFLDGKEIFRKKYTAGKGDGPWKRSNYLKQYDVYQCDYDETVEFKIPKGRHELRLSNVGKDWLGMKKLTLVNYLKAEQAGTRSLSMTVGDTTLLWIQNKAYTWRNMDSGKAPQEIALAVLTIKGIPDGEHDIEWWNTFEGKVISNEKAAAKDGTLHLNIPAFLKDIACKIKN